GGSWRGGLGRVGGRGGGWGWGRVGWTVGWSCKNDFNKAGRKNPAGTGSAAHDKFFRSSRSGSIGKRSFEFLRLFDDRFDCNLKQTSFFCEPNSASALYIELRSAFSFEKSQLLSHRWLAILLKNPHFLFLIDAKNAFDSNTKVARDKFSSTLILTRENKLLLALKRG